jgi:hypothetical protein
VVFAPDLAWPPGPDEPHQLKQAARRRVSAYAVKVRLEGARTKAEGLGIVAGQARRQSRSP